MSGKNFAALRILSVVLAGYTGSALYAQSDTQSDVASIQVDAPATPQTDLKTTSPPEKKSLTWADEQGGALSTFQEIPARAKKSDSAVVKEATPEAAETQVDAAAENAKTDSDFESAKAQAEQEKAEEADTFEGFDATSSADLWSTPRTMDSDWESI